MATALVTGSNRGIGLALTRRLAARGDQVIAVCRRGSADLGALAASGKVRVEEGIDLESDEAVSALAERLGEATLDLLVLNAGILRADSLDTLRLEDVREQFEVNALAPLRVAKHLRGGLRRGAKIGAITSRMGSIGDNGSGGYYGYRMSKAALNAMARSLAVDLRGEGVAVAVLHPGYVRTEMTGGNGNVDPDEAARMLIQRLDELTLETSGTFWHANGEVLPW